MEPLLPAAPTTPALPRRILGFSALASLVISWVAQSEVAQFIQAAAPDGLGYDKPYLVTWVNHSAMALLLPVLWLRHTGLLAHVASETGSSLRRVLGLCAVLSVAYTAGDYVWYVALPLTSVSEATAIFNSQSVFTYALSVLLLGEPLRLSKVGCVMVSLAGIVVTAVWGGSGTPADDSGSGDQGSGIGDRLGGDLLVLGAAASYSLYEVCFKRALGKSTDVCAVNALTGLVGACSLIVAAPGFPVLHSMGIERLEVPSATVVGWFVLNASLALVFNVGLLLTVATLSPLTASMGCLLTMPLSMLVDLAWHHTVPSWGDVCGALLVALGFGLLVLADSRAEREQHLRCGDAGQSAAGCLDGTGRCRIEGPADAVARQEDRLQRG